MPFSHREYQRALFGLDTARSITAQAYTNLGHRDPYHLRLAQQAFNRPVDFATLDTQVGMILDNLDLLRVGLNVWVGTCDEPDCHDGIPNFVAITLNDLSGIVLCSFYFVQPGRTFGTTCIPKNWTHGQYRCELGARQ